MNLEINKEYYIKLRDGLKFYGRLREYKRRCEYLKFEVKLSNNSYDDIRIMVYNIESVREKSEFSISIERFNEIVNYIWNFDKNPREPYCILEICQEIIIQKIEKEIKNYEPIKTKRIKFDLIPTYTYPDFIKYILKTLEENEIDITF